MRPPSGGLHSREWGTERFILFLLLRLIYYYPLTCFSYFLLYLLTCRLIFSFTLLTTLIA